MKNDKIRNFIWSVFYRIRTEYEELDNLGKDKIP